MIFETLLLILATTNTVIGLTTYWKLFNWYDFYVPIVLFLGSYIVGLAILWIVCDIISRCLKPEHHNNNISKIGKFILIQGCQYINFHAIAYVKIIGKEKLPVNDRFLFVCNHISRFDPMVSIAELGSKDIAFITKPGNMRIPIGGRIIKTLHFQEIVREDPLKSLEVMNNSISLIKNNITSIGVYPEGTRNKELGEFHEGVFNIALKAKCPLVVSVIKNSEKIVKNFPLKATKVIHEIVCTIPFEEIEGKTCKQVSDEVKELIALHLRKLENE